MSFFDGWGIIDWAGAAFMLFLLGVLVGALINWYIVSGARREYADYEDYPDKESGIEHLDGK